MKDHKSPLTRALPTRDSFVSMTRGVEKPRAGVRMGMPVQGTGKYTVAKAEKPRCAGNDGACKAYPMKDSEYCYGHSRSEGGQV